MSINFDKAKEERMRASINLLTANQISERMSQVHSYMMSISPGLSRYRELRIEYDLLRTRWKELTQPQIL